MLTYHFLVTFYWPHNIFFNLQFKQYGDDFQNIRYFTVDPINKPTLVFVFTQKHNTVVVLWTLTL